MEKMNEFHNLANDLQRAGETEVAEIAIKMKAPSCTMRVTHPSEAAYGGLAWNGWSFPKVHRELMAQRKTSSSQDRGRIYNAIVNLEEKERLGVNI